MHKRRYSKRETPNPKASEVGIARVHQKRDCHNLRVPFWEVPEKYHSLLGSILGSPYLGELEEFVQSSPGIRYCLESQYPTIMAGVF